MKLIPLLDLAHKALHDGYAVPSFCVWNAETMKTVLRVADRLEAPVALMNGPGEFPLLNPAEMGAIAHGLPVDTMIPVALHLDHGNSLEQVRECLRAGYTSVMLDYSDKPFGENVRALQQVVALARPLNVSVEGELGAVGKVDDVTVEGRRATVLTDPAQALTFVRETGIDLLAVAIGNAHGDYTQLPRLRFDLLESIYAAVKIPLVLHGGSGTPDADIQRAIASGVAKINVASELVRVVRETIRDRTVSETAAWLPMVLQDAMLAMEPVVEQWIVRVGAAGKAW
jgi:ketose-bisphosphate aldolase